MTVFLDQLKAHLIPAQKRVEETQQKAQAAQAEFQVAVQEFNSLQLLVNLHAAREQKTTPPTTRPQAAIQNPEANKTRLVLDLIRQHPGGIKPTEIWKNVGPQLGRRQYLYSVLKRLKDREEISERQGKYMAKITEQREATPQPILVQ